MNMVLEDFFNISQIAHGFMEILNQIILCCSFFYQIKFDIFCIYAEVVRSSFNEYDPIKLQINNKKKKWENSSMYTIINKNMKWSEIWYFHEGIWNLNQKTTRATMCLKSTMWIDILCETVKCIDKTSNQFNENNELFCVK